MDDFETKRFFTAVFGSRGSADDEVLLWEDWTKERQDSFVLDFEDGELPVLVVAASGIVLTTRRLVSPASSVRTAELISVTHANPSGRYKLQNGGLRVCDKAGTVLHLPMRMGSGCVGLWNVLRKIAVKNELGQ